MPAAASEPMRPASGAPTLFAMALLRTLEMLEAGERLNEELYRSTTRGRPDSTFLARPLDPWRDYRAMLPATAPPDKRAVSGR